MRIGSCHAPNGTVRLTIEGPFLDPDVDMDVAIRRLVNSIDRESGANIELDISGVTWLTLEGIGVLIRCRQHADRSGRTMRITHSPSQAAGAIRRAGLDGWFGV
jgi:anti-anti-sigma regulatory factor